MAKSSSYLPRTDRDRVVWFNNFVTKFSVQATGLGFVAADVTAVTNDAAMFAYLVNQVEIYTTAKEQRVDYKNLIKEGPLGSVGGAVPSAPPAGTVPTVVLPGIFPRLALLVKRIKVAPTYTDAIGKDLGVVSEMPQFNSMIMKPALKLVMKGGQVEVQWVKGDSDGVRIEVDRGTGAWQFLAIDTVPHYPDTTPISAAANWKYRAMYIIEDETVGQWSDVASISVG